MMEQPPMKSDGAKKRDAEEQLDPEGQPGMVKRNSSNESSTDSSNEYHLSSESSESASPREPQKKASPIIDSDSGESEEKRRQPVPDSRPFMEKHFALSQLKQWDNDWDKLHSGYEELFKQRKREREEQLKREEEEKAKKEEEEEEMLEVKDDSPHDQDMVGSPQREEDGVLPTDGIESPPVVLADDDSNADVVVDRTTGLESMRMVDAKTQMKNRKMDKEIKQKLIADFTRTIILVRHGAYNKEGEREEDKKLSDVGVKEVKNAADKILTLHEKMVGDREIGLVCSSNLTRSIETANIIKEKLKQSEKVVRQEKDSYLEEALQPPFPYLPYDGEWSTTPNWDREKMRLAKERLDTAFDKYFKRATREGGIKTVVLACHANVIRYLVCKALQLPMEVWQRLKCDNGSLTVIKIYPDGAVKLALLNDISQKTEAPVIAISDTPDDSVDTPGDTVDTPSTSATLATLDTSADRDN